MIVLSDYITAVKNLEAKKVTALQADHDQTIQRQQISLMVDAMSKLCITNGIRSDQQSALTAINEVWSTQASSKVNESQAVK